MTATRIAAVLLIVAGLLVLVYGSFGPARYTVGAGPVPLALTVSEQRYANGPVWAGIGAIAIGALLLVAGGRRG